MAEINKLGNIVARCPGCDGGKSTFVFNPETHVLGSVIRREPNPYHRNRGDVDVQYRLFRCSGCGMGALAKIRMLQVGAQYPGKIWTLVWFMPEAKERLRLPENVPHGIANEFREAERCLEEGCFRAAAAMFRSVLEKVFRANGYNTRRERNLEDKIDVAAADGVITKPRKRRAHEEVRVLGNDVLHDEWHKITEEDVEPAHHYIQRILEDFYDDRETVLGLLREAERTPLEDIPKEEETEAKRKTKPQVESPT